jgi:hypothetical protein
LKITVDRVTVSEAGDYLQVSFTTEHDADGPYMILQRQFEDPDDDLCYIETHDNAYTGHFRILFAQLQRRRLRIQIHDADRTWIEVSFDATANAFANLKRTLMLMIPELAVANAERHADNR